MAVGGVVLNFVAKTAEATRDIGKVTRELGQVDRAAKSTGGALKKIGGAAKLGVAGVAAGAGVAAFAFVDMAKAAYEDAQAQAKLEHTLGRVKGVTDDAAAATSAWIDEMELATLVSDTELRKALGKLTIATGDLSDAQDLAALSQDAAVGSGREFSSVADAMAKAAAGNTNALKRMFPWLDAGPDKVLTLAEAMEQLEAKYKGAAGAAAENDVFGRLAVAWGQISEAIGTAALPTLQAISDWFSDKSNISQIQEWITQLQGWATAIGEDFKGKLTDFISWLNSGEGQRAIKDFTTSMGNFATAIGDIASSIDDLVGPFQRLKSATDWLPSNLVLKWLGGGMPGLSGGGGPFGSAFGGTPGPVKPRTDTTGGARANSAGVTVNVYNPKPERGSASVAAALRVTRPARGSGGAW